MYKSMNDGLILGQYTIFITICLEIISFNYVVEVLRQPKGIQLYTKAIFMNFLNNIICGPLIWTVTVPLLCDNSNKFNIFKSCILILIHSTGYYIAHVALHKPYLYKYHRLHHKFSMYVTPITANCVTLVEYTMAYMLPFVIGIILINSNVQDLQFAVKIVSISNLLIHTPFLSNLSLHTVPWFLCSTHDHLDHHRRLNTNYAAPTISIDRLIDSTKKYINS